MVAFATPGPMELIIIMVIILLIFGGSKLPGLAKGLGQGIREFKKAIGGGGKDEVEENKEISEQEPDKK